MNSIVVCVASSERTWQNLSRYCFNAPFRANRHRFDLAIGFNGDDPEAFRAIDMFTPEYLLQRPNTGHDLANFDNLIKRIPAYDTYVFMHDDHWFFDEGWVDRLLELRQNAGGIDVFGNLVASDVTGPMQVLYDRLAIDLGYDEILGKQYPHFLQGLAGMYRGSVIRDLLSIDGIPHIHRSVQLAAQVFERMFSFLLLERGWTLGQIPPGYEMYLVHRDHSIVAIKLEQAAAYLEAGDDTHAQQIFGLLKGLRPNDPVLQQRIEELWSGRQGLQRGRAGS